MALKLIAPGERGNKVFMARGSVNGRLREISLKTTDRAVARRALREWQARLGAEGRVPRGVTTFAEAARRYTEFRNPGQSDCKLLDKITAELGRRPLREITVAELHDLANKLYPGTKPSTRNRHVLRPAAAVLHYAAEAGLCDWLKVRLFPEDTPHTVALDQETAAKLIEAAKTGRQRLLLLWLFHQGMRITHTLNVTWDKIDLTRGTVRHREIKGRKSHDWTFPLHAEVLFELRLIPKRDRVGRVFPWSNRSSLGWLRRLGEGLGIKFTPHMARHSRGTWLSDQGASLRSIMEALGHASERSSLRYQHGNIEVVRALGDKISLKKAG